MGGGLTTRMVILERGEGLVVVIVVALPDDLEAAWRQAQDILATVDLVA